MSGESFLGGVTHDHDTGLITSALRMQKFAIRIESVFFVCLLIYKKNIIVKLKYIIRDCNVNTGYKY